MAKSKKEKAEAFSEAGEAKANAEADKKEANSADALKLRKFGKFQGKGK